MWEIHNSNLTQHIIFLSKNNKKSLISKRLESGENLQETNFIWDGSHLVQEIDHKTNRTYCYIYSHPNSYEPLAQWVFAKNSKNPTACYYYHNDQIGIPRELTDEEGKVCWYGSYAGWGKLKESYQANDTVHQPFRLQNQYYDSEIGLHYNFFRYYEPNVGRFTQLDPIGLAGGENLYRFEGTIQNQIDPLGLFAPAGYAGYALWVMLFGTAAHIGIQGTMEAMEESKQPSVSSTSETSGISKCGKNNCCPPCNPHPVGTLGYIGPRTVQRGADGARNNDGVGIAHFKVFAVQQNPNDCTCRWEQTKKVMREFGHHTYFIPAGAINLNGKGVVVY